MSDAFTLRGRTALVAGASRGIGLEIAKGLARAGTNTVLAARSVALLEREAAQLRAQGAEATALHLDVRDRASIDEAVAGRTFDILVAVAGDNARRPFVDFPEDDYARVVETNLTAIATLVQTVGRQLVKRNAGGKIVVLGSVAGLVGLPYTSVYAFAKSGLAGLTRALAAEWAQHRIQINCVVPGFILTDMTRKVWEQPAMTAWLSGAQANPRLGTPDDVAPLVVFLCGSGSDYITGQTIAVDGGFSTTSMWPFEPDRDARSS
jgi:gluconate 5-dehydrogenase